MSDKDTMELISSLLGYISTSASIAAYIPMMTQTWANKSNSITPYFVYLWLVADTSMLISTILMQPQEAIYVLSVWFLLSDVMLLVQLMRYGSTAPGGRKVRKGKIILSRLEILEKSESKQAWYTRFKTWDGWDTVKIFLICLMSGITFWGIMELTAIISPRGAPANNNTIAVKVTGYIAQIIFCSSRLSEFWNGYLLCKMYKADQCSKYAEDTKYTKSYKPHPDNKAFNQHLGFKEESKLSLKDQIKIDEPGVSSGSLLFYFTILANTTQIICILTSWKDISDLQPQYPMLAGSAVAVVLDLTLLLTATFIWWPLWRRTRTYAEIDALNGELEKERNEKLRELALLEIKIAGDDLSRYDEWFKVRIDVLQKERDHLTRQGKSVLSISQLIDQEVQVRKKLEQFLHKTLPHYLK